MLDIACLCGHGSTQHTENAVLGFGYRCTECACQMLQSRPDAPMVEVPDDTCPHGRLLSKGFICHQCLREGTGDAALLDVPDQPTPDGTP